MALNKFPHSKGTYVLVVKVNFNKTLSIGKLGKFTFIVGYYFYIGSSFGPGGLRARLNRHLSQHKNLHWHIDYLVKYGQIKQVWYNISPVQQEHRWAQVFSILPSVEPAVKKFGASDCRCLTHLFYTASSNVHHIFESFCRRISKAPVQKVILT
ncbi:MAG: GIY-YIG nuclease family protein [Bacteroidetes bacterium]|nr:MAG: GIY-YIG nuclease family protein [Bacteroidota bacterium]